MYVEWDKRPQSGERRLERVVLSLRTVWRWIASSPLVFTTQITKLNPKSYLQGRRPNVPPAHQVTSTHPTTLSKETNTCKKCLCTKMAVRLVALSHRLTACDALLRRLYSGCDALHCAVWWGAVSYRRFSCSFPCNYHLSVLLAV